MVTEWTIVWPPLMQSPGNHSPICAHNENYSAEVLHKVDTYSVQSATVFYGTIPLAARSNFTLAKYEGSGNPYLQNNNNYYHDI